MGTSKTDLYENLWENAEDQLIYWKWFFVVGASNNNEEAICFTLGYFFSFLQTTAHRSENCS